MLDRNDVLSILFAIDKLAMAAGLDEAIHETTIVSTIRAGSVNMEASTEYCYVGYVLYDTS